MLTASACFDIQEFRSTSQASDDSFKEFSLPAIEFMSICPQLSKKKKNAFENTENRRVRYALIPAVFGVDCSSPAHVTSWRYKPVNCFNSNTERKFVQEKAHEREWNET